VTQRPWTAEDFPFLAEHVDGQEALLARIAELALRPRWYVPIVSARSPSWLSDRPVIAIRALRGAVNLLRARAMYSLGAGEVEAAWKDALTCHRLARLVATDIGITQRALGSGIETAALSIGLQVSLAHGLGSDRACQYGAALRNMTPLPPVVDAIDLGERCGAMDVAAMLYRSVRQPLDHDFMMGRINGLYDRLVEHARLPRAEGKAAYRSEADKFVARHETLAARYKGWSGKCRILLMSAWQRRELGSTLLSNAAVCLVLPTYLGIEARLEAEAERAILTVAFALAAHRADHGWYPVDPRDLVPKYLPCWPADPFTGDGMLWCCQAGERTIYSVGANKVDDKGDGEKDVSVSVR
jgi:hypothetical protein